MFRLLRRQARLRVPKKRPRKAASRRRPLPAMRPNQVCAYDFVFDGCAVFTSLGGNRCGRWCRLAYTHSFLKNEKTTSRRFLHPKSFRQPNDDGEGRVVHLAY